MPVRAFRTVDEYIATYPKHVQVFLQELRQVIHDSAPGAEEAISYQMPAFKLLACWYGLQPSRIT